MNFLRRIGAVAAKEVRQLRRDRLSFGMIVALPVMQLLLFGYAINLDPRHLAAGVDPGGFRRGGSPSGVSTSSRSGAITRS